MNYEELKKYCDSKIKEYPQYLKRYKKEIIIGDTSVISTNNCLTLSNMVITPPSLTKIILYISFNGGK